MKYFWPDLDDIKDAHKACGAAAGIAFFIAILTGVITWLQTTGKINVFPGLKEIAYIDVLLFTLIGIGISFHSRVAAVGGLLLYAAERYFMISSYGFRPGQVTAVIIFGLAFINGVRGTFAWHEFKRAEQPEGSVAVSEETVAVLPKKSFLGKVILIFLVVSAAGAGAYFFLMNKGSMPAFDTLRQKAQSLTKTVSPKKAAVPLVAPNGPAIKLKLKSGRAFEGILVKKNSEGYWVFIDGMGDIFFSVNEVAEAS